MFRETSADHLPYHADKAPRDEAERQALEALAAGEAGRVDAEAEALLPETARGCRCAPTDARRNETAKYRLINGILHRVAERRAALRAGAGLGFLAASAFGPSCACGAPSRSPALLTLPPDRRFPRVGLLRWEDLTAERHDMHEGSYCAFTALGAERKPASAMRCCECVHVRAARPVLAPCCASSPARPKPLLHTLTRPTAPAPAPVLLHPRVLEARLLAALRRA